ncbi:MAG: hypothetical protein KJN63_07310 [Acidimicrobiia bacterium]|nr:hypothetical protein [Acidimicrobiia bacterium]
MNGELAARDHEDEPGLFVIWAKARHDEKEILADLAGRFRLTGAFEIHWTPALVRRNFERFYCDLDVRGVYHEINKGSGPFIAATVIDTQPAHDMRQTSRGPRTVNTNFHDAKVEYRARVGHMGLHCSETEAETRRDTLLLLGRDVCDSENKESSEPWNGALENLEIDVAGANGWDSEADLLRALDASARYVVLGAPPDSADSLFDGPEEIQILTSDYHALETVMNGRSRLGQAPPSGGRFTVNVGGRRVEVGIRLADDGYIDSNWARTCLEDRVLDSRQFYRPAEPDDLATRCYSALTRRGRLTDRDRKMIQRLAEWDSDAPGERADVMRSIDRADATAVIGRYLSKRGYNWALPLDPTVPHHIGRAGREHRQRAAQGAIYVLTGITRGFLKTRWLAVRDALVFRAPALRQHVRRWMGHS